MNKELTSDLACGAELLVLALAATGARKLGYIEGETVTRVVMCATGLMIAWYGNRMPKKFVPDAWAYRATRLAGWSMALSGLACTALWVFAPTQAAIVGGSSAIIVGILVTLTYCMKVRGKAERRIH